MMRILTILLFSVFTVFFVCAQDELYNGDISYTDEDIQMVEAYFRMIESKSSLPFGDLVIETAKYFVNTPYVASTLEMPKEHLVINLRELDCTTFVENVIALVATVKQGGSPAFGSFCANLGNLRYRTGAFYDYIDRLHYFSDWIYTNEQIGYVEDITRQIGGEPYALRLSFMSTHSGNYPLLKGRPAEIEAMQAVEREISARNVYAMIPKAKINDCASQVRNGDIICFVTNIEGLDVTHVGFAYWKGDVLGFIHASSVAKKVFIDPKHLQGYAENVKSTIGIMVVRPGGKF